MLWYKIKEGTIFGGTIRKTILKKMTFKQTLTLGSSSRDAKKPATGRVQGRAVRAVGTRSKMMLCSRSWEKTAGKGQKGKAETGRVVRDQVILTSSKILSFFTMQTVNWREHEWKQTHVSGSCRTSTSLRPAWDTPGGGAGYCKGGGHGTWGDGRDAAETEWEESRRTAR